MAGRRRERPEPPFNSNLNSVPLVNEILSHAAYEKKRKSVCEYLGVIQKQRAKDLIWARCFEAR